MAYSCCFSLGGNLDSLTKVFNMDYSSRAAEVVHMVFRSLSTPGLCGSYPLIGNHQEKLLFQQNVFNNANIC